LKIKIIVNIVENNYLKIRWKNKRKIRNKQKILEKFSCDKDEEIERLNNLNKDWENKNCNCCEIECLVVINKIVGKNSNILEYENSIDFWSYWRKLWFISSIIKQKLKDVWEEVR
jgi:hypothetical protein